MEQRKRVDGIEGYYATAPYKNGLFTVMAMSVDGTVTEFEDLYPVQMSMLCHAFEADDAVLKYVVKKW